MTSIRPGFEAALSPAAENSHQALPDISPKLLRHGGCSDPALA